MKENFPTIDAVAYRNHLFQMTVSPTHSVNINGLLATMKDLDLLGPGGASASGAAAASQPCFLYFAVPPDVFSMYQHKAGAMVPTGSVLPANISLVVLEIPLPHPQPAAASASASSSSSSSGLKRKHPHPCTPADSLVPPSKQPVVTTCECNTGCTKNTCKCLKYGNKCSAKCHTDAEPAVGCRNRIH